MQQSWAEFIKKQRAEISREEMDRLYNGRWSDEGEESLWNDGSRSPSSPDIPSATTEE